MRNSKTGFGGLLITQCRKDAAIRYFSDNDPVISYAQSGEATMMTKSQRTPEWFLLQKVWITGTGAYDVWQLLGCHYAEVCDENITAVLRVLSLGQGEQEEVVNEVVYTHEHLYEMVLPDLHVICCHKGLPVSGTKQACPDKEN